jgi:DNA-binding CsgD family transcriptional regulator
VVVVRPVARLSQVLQNRDRRKGVPVSWQSVWSRASRIGQDPEQWRHDLARAIREAARTDYASVATCRQSDFLMLDFSTYPADYAAVNDLGNRLFPRRLEAVGEGWQVAVRRNGTVYAPALDTRDKEIASDIQRLMLGPAGLRGLLGGFMIVGGDLIGAVSVASSTEHRALLAGARESLARTCQTATRSLIGSLRLAAACGWAPPPRRAIVSCLSLREQQVARLAASGHSNLNIAMQLGLAEPTVSTHLQHIYRKLGVHSRVALSRLLG